MNNSENTLNSVDEFEEEERTATALELFLDLAFVFAISQVTGFIAADLTVENVLKGVLLAWLVWWLWTAFTWTGAAIDFQENALHRVFILCMVPAILIMAVALPNSFDESAVWFAVSFFVVQVWITLIQGFDAWKDKGTRLAWLSYGPLALVAPFVLIIGSLFDGDVRLSLWILVAVINILAALFGGKTSENAWKLNSSHFTERHSLFMIIILGEVIVAIGIKASSLSEKTGITFNLALAAAVSISVACMYWWSYFAYIPKVIENKLRTASPEMKGKYARDICSFGLFPLVVSVIFFAVVAKHLLEYPLETFENNDLILLGISGVGFMGGILMNQWRIAKYVSKERIIALLALVLTAFLGQFIDAWLTVFIFSTIIGVVSILIWFNFKKTEIYKQIWN